MQKYVFGRSELRLMYSDEELDRIIGIYINEHQGFSYLRISNHILTEADKAGKLEKEDNTSYSQIALTLDDGKRISRLLWKYIFDKKIIIDFTISPYRERDNTYFVRY
jgi:hypothetical protein